MPPDALLSLLTGAGAAVAAVLLLLARKIILVQVQLFDALEEQHLLARRQGQEIERLVRLLRELGEDPDRPFYRGERFTAPPLGANVREAIAELPAPRAPAPPTPLPGRSPYRDLAPLGEAVLAPSAARRAARPQLVGVAVGLGLIAVAVVLRLLLAR